MVKPGALLTGIGLVLTLAACSGQSTPSASSPSAGGSKAPSASSPASPKQPKGASAAGKPHATEFHPPGDIPDNQVYLDYRIPGSRVHIKVPEGWPRSTAHGVTTFTDKYNSVAIQVTSAPHPPTPVSVRRTDIPQLRRQVSAFAAPHVTTVTRQHGHAVLLGYLLDSAPSPVTGKVVRDAAQRFLFRHNGQEAVLVLTGPKTADNVDPWRLVSNSLRWS